MTRTKPQIQHDHSADHITPQSSSEEDAATLTTAAERILRFRRHRERIFAPSHLFSDPAWDILLEIFRSAARGVPIAVSDTSACAGIASSSATRWIRTLETAGLVRRSPDPDDKRRVLLDITPMGHDLMKRTLAAWSPEGKALADRPRIAVPLFFAAPREAAKSAGAFGQLRALAAQSPIADLPSVIIRCLNEFQKRHKTRPSAEMSLQIDNQVERMLGIGAYESAVLLIGRTFCHSWAPSMAGAVGSGTVPASADLGRILLKDLLDGILAQPEDPVAG